MDKDYTSVDHSPSNAMSRLDTDSNCSTDLQAFSCVQVRRSVRSNDFSSRIHSIISEQAKSWQVAKLSFDTELDSLRNKISVAKELSEQQKRKISNLLKQKEMLETRLDSEVRKREHTLNQLSRTLKTHERYKSQHDLLDAEIQRLQHKVESLSKDAEKYHQGMQDLTQRYRQLESAYVAKTEEARALGLSLQETQGNQQSLSVRNKELEQRLNVYQEKVEEVKQEKLTLERQVKEAQWKEEQLESAAKQREAVLAETTAHCESLVKDLEAEKLAREQEIAQVQQELTAQVNQNQLALNAKEDDLNRVKETVEACNNQLNFLQGQCEQLESSLAQARQEVGVGKLANTALEEQMHIREDELALLRGLVSAKEKKIAELEEIAKDTSEKSVLEEKVADLQHEVRKWEEDYERILYAYDFFRKRSDEWGPLLFEKERELREAVQERVDCGRKIEAMELDNRNLEEQVKRLEESLLQVSEEMKTARCQHAQEKGKTLSDFEARFSNLCLELEHEKERSRELDEKLEAECELKAKQTAELNEKRAFAERKTKEIENLERQLVEKRNQIAELESTVKKLEQMVESLQAACLTQKAVAKEAPKVQDLGFMTNINHEAPAKPATMCSQPKTSGTLFDSSPPCSQEATAIYDLISPSPPEESKTTENAVKQSEPATVRQPDPEWLRPPPAGGCAKKSACTVDPFSFSQDLWNSNDSLDFTMQRKKPAEPSLSAFRSVRKRVNFDEKEDSAGPTKITRDMSSNIFSTEAGINPASRSEATAGDTRGKGRSRGSGRGRLRSTGSGRGRGRGGYREAPKLGDKTVRLVPVGRMDAKHSVKVDAKQMSSKTTRTGRKCFPVMNPSDLYMSLASSESDSDS